MNANAKIFMSKIVFTILIGCFFSTEKAEARYSEDAIAQAVLQGKLHEVQSVSVKELSYRHFRTGRRLMHMAVSSGNFAIADFLHSEGQSFDVVDYQGYTPLAECARCGNLQGVAYLLQFRIDINKGNPLKLAVMNNHFEMVQLLLLELFKKQDIASLKSIEEAVLECNDFEPVEALYFFQQKKHMIHLNVQEAHRTFRVFLHSKL